MVMIKTLLLSGKLYIISTHSAFILSLSFSDGTGKDLVEYTNKMMDNIAILSILRCK
jgi:hypothetical protein